MSQLCALAMLKANNILGYINRRIASRSTEVTISHFLALVKPLVECCVRIWFPCTRRVLINLSESSGEASKAGGLEHRKEKRQRKLNLIILQKR